MDEEDAGPGGTEQDSITLIAVLVAIGLLLVLAIIAILVFVWWHNQNEQDTDVLEYETDGKEMNLGESDGEMEPENWGIEDIHHPISWEYNEGEQGDLFPRNCEEAF
jgi:flagellar basal body-associated protein FliL